MSREQGEGGMNHTEHGFAIAEYRSRLAALQEGMARAGLAALLFTTEPDIHYVTGFATRFWQSPTRPWFVVLPGVGEPVAVIPAIGRVLMAKTWLSDIRTWPSPDPLDDGVTLLAQTLLSQTLRELAPSHALTGGPARIGLPMGPATHLRMPLADFALLREAIAPASFVDATAIVHHVREVKSSAEIARIRAACGIADRAFAKVPDIAGEGRPLDAVFRDFQIACLAAGADWVPYLAGGAGQGGYSDVISPASPTPLARGDVLMLDTGVVRAGYFADFDRNFAIGRADDDVRRAYATLHAATEAGLEAARPGATAADLHRVMRAAIERAGGKALDGRFGHGLGLELTEWPSSMPGDRTVLRPGMVLTLEPGLEVRPGRIMVHEENIVLRAHGAELLSRRAPPELPVLR